MTDVTMTAITHPSIAQARSMRAEYLARLLRIAAKSAMRKLRRYAGRVAMARQYRRELAVLMQADDRMLMDIGLTRMDVAAATERWFTPGRMIEAAAMRREQAMTAAHRRSALPRVQAPALVPAAVPAERLATADAR